MKMKRIASVMTKSTFMHIEDALADIGKVRVFVGTYTRGQGMHEHIIHYIDADDALVLAYDLLAGAEVDYTEYKGSRNGDGEVRARVLRVNSAYDKEHGNKYFFEFTEGLGEEMATGAVKMAGAPDTKVTVPLDNRTARRIGARLYAYLLQNAHFGEEQEWEKGEGEGTEGKAGGNGRGMKDPDEEPKAGPNGPKPKPKKGVQGDARRRFNSIIGQAVREKKISPDKANELLDLGKREGWDTALAELLAVLPD